ncbi:Hypothetical predicted protein [Paramuricea clavata]|uniref:Uncharacterized protein n=1 Tax=Paramuricea clavata TaxID=317549 RepID=A0A6S7JF38_PARCT|nr:Hypothetical predicted protein [Paramuricea clavata]
MRGAICSRDMTKRMYAISQQDCIATAGKCVLIPTYKAYFNEVCKLLPDGNTAKKVPLPVPSKNNNAANNAANSG